eukprot:881453-Rhodomonas_salina.1
MQYRRRACCAAFVRSPAHKKAACGLQRRRAFALVLSAACLYRRRTSWHVTRGTKAPLRSTPRSTAFGTALAAAPTALA